MSNAKLVNIARLMTTYNLEIEQLPDDLKCAQCKLVLKDACQLPCSCRFCRVCIVDMIERGAEFCPGDSEDCGQSLLSLFSTDHLANKGVWRLAVKCPHDGCVHKCQLANIEEHLRECPRKGEECPFYELGCTQDKLTADEMGGHLQHDNRRHIEILIRMIVNINREIDSLKLRDEVSSREIETLKGRDEASSREIETLKQELVQKDGQIRSIMDQMIHVQNDIKLIQEEKEDLAGQVTILAEKIDREIAERRENEELYLAGIIEHVDKEITAITRLIGSNKDESAIEMQSVRGDIGSTNQSVQSIKDDICSVKSQVQSVQALVGLGQVDASFEWLIDIEVEKTDLLEGEWYKKEWYDGDRESEYFTGEMHPYKYQLGSWSCDIGTADAALNIYLRIYAGPNDGQLAWPFEARVVITVTNRDRREACRSISLQCRIERPLDKYCRSSDIFVFLYSELRGAGLNLSRGARVSCVIVPGAA